MKTSEHGWAQLGTAGERAAQQSQLRAACLPAVTGHAWRQPWAFPPQLLCAQYLSRWDRIFCGTPQPPERCAFCTKNTSTEASVLVSHYKSVCTRMCAFHGESAAHNRGRRRCWECAVCSRRMHPGARQAASRGLARAAVDKERMHPLWGKGRLRPVLHRTGKYDATSYRTARVAPYLAAAMSISWSAMVLTAGFPTRTCRPGAHHNHDTAVQRKLITMIIGLENTTTTTQQYKGSLSLRA